MLTVHKTDVNKSIKQTVKQNKVKINPTIKQNVKCN